ncbi:hypothetical protein GF359_06795 [candidate division WOR-3 bacterium]|uniref:T9SS type A sorting domain-containing protein n=1 Tax=candidate division WOR-3 bacterium TaxID=2052148 RepID=A0A9D5QEC4_UNCW3|nr:hypothetical protein [candidate division WOR-3 bacterium]MBD3364905.1 hypothetical protein [candidate division WOR-3 bacterium]
MNRIRFIWLIILPSISLGADGVSVFNQGGSLTFNIEIPSSELSKSEDGTTRIRMEEASGENLPGYPRLPLLTCTFALPPGTRVKNVDVTGSRKVIPGEYAIEASRPQLPRSASQELARELNSIYEKNYERVYSGVEKLSTKLGLIQSAGHRREYSLVTVRFNPFLYDPATRRLSAAENLTLTIDYEPLGNEASGFIQDFLDKGTIHPDVPAEVYNKAQAREWYRPSRRLSPTRGMIIITTEDLVSLTGSYVSWREKTGFHVIVVTIQEIDAGTEGADIQEKVRNWLREHVANYQYLLIIGHHWDIPWRTLTLFNDNYAPSWMKYDDFYPHPSDLYYSGLSEPDSASWNLDADSYYGETLVMNGSKNPQDAADLEPELYVGRINSSSAEKVSDALQGFVAYDKSMDDAYKGGSVVVGGILGYYTYSDKWDDSYYMEAIMNNGIINRSKAITLYEKEGASPSEFDCDLPYTQSNLISALADNDVGLFIESSHGTEGSILRTVWIDENEDSIPDWGEIESVVGLEKSDAPQLNSSHPNAAVLLSCLCGHPETGTCLAQALLSNGSAGVLACTRVAWGAQDDWDAPGDGGDYDLCYYYLDNLYNESESYDYVIGDALADARSRYWSECSSIGDFCNAYGYNYYGDPALRLFGREGVEENHPRILPTALEIDENSTVRFSIPCSGIVRLVVWDAAGRRIQGLYRGNMTQGQHSISWDTSQLPAGSYFVTLVTQGRTLVAKAVLLH